jgi:hypothetical protein
VNRKPPPPGPLDGIDVTLDRAGRLTAASLTRSMKGLRRWVCPDCSRPLVGDDARLSIHHEAPVCEAFQAKMAKLHLTPAGASVFVDDSNETAAVANDVEHAPAPPRSWLVYVDGARLPVAEVEAVDGEQATARAADKLGLEPSRLRLFCPFVRGLHKPERT